MFLLCYREHRGAPDFFHAEKIYFGNNRCYLRDLWLPTKTRLFYLKPLMNTNLHEFHPVLNPPQGISVN